MKTVFVPVVWFACCAGSMVAQAQETTITVTIRGVINDRCAAVLQAELGKVSGIKVAANTISRGEGKQFFCDPFVIEIEDLEKTDIGTLAEVVGKARTPLRDEMEPCLNLILYTSDRIDEDLVVGLRTELRDTNGVLVDEPGGLGGVPNQGYLWVRLDAIGGASLSSIVTATERANVKVSLTK